MILKNSKNISEKLKEYSLTYETFKNEIIDIIGIGKEENNIIHALLSKLVSIIIHQVEISFTGKLDIFSG